VGLVHFRYKFLRRFLHRDNGFTLTELAIAMVVLGVIASIALPSFLGSRNNSYDKEAQTSIENVLRAAIALYSSQGDFSNAGSAGCGTDAGAGPNLAADLQKLEPNVDVVGGSVVSTNSRVVSVDARPTFNSNGEKLGCQAFYATVFSSSGTCFVARLTFEGKFLLASSVSPIRIASQLNTQNVAVTTWSALAANGVAYAQIRSRSSGADADNTQTLALIQSNCKAQTQSTGSATAAAYYADPGNFYQSWRDTTTNPASPAQSTCAQGGTCTVGNDGPGGGTVFYVSATNFTSTGSDCGTSCKYLEYAPIGWIVSTTPSGQTNCEIAGTSTVDPKCRMFASGLTTHTGTATAIGSGLANTTLITGVSNTAGRAATVTRAFRGGSKSDWFLPSQDELNELCKYARQQTTGNTSTQCSNANSLRTGFTSGFYWSSTENGATTSNYQSFSDGDRDNRDKAVLDSVRPVRAFG
jgi:prepilin-type N-terminal cleavage/methylation domain-containing protein